MSSFTPVTVTVCSTLQFPDVNVIEPGLTVPSPSSELVSPISTFAVGSLVNTTVNVSDAEPSVVTSPVVGTTVTPATSSSSFVTDTSDASIVL